MNHEWRWCPGHWAVMLDYAAVAVFPWMGSGGPTYKLGNDTLMGMVERRPLAQAEISADALWSWLRRVKGKDDPQLVMGARFNRDLLRRICQRAIPSRKGTVTISMLNTTSAEGVGCKALAMQRDDSTVIAMPMREGKNVAVGNDPLRVRSW
jgi:hypothetical protein